MRLAWKLTSIDFIILLACFYKLFAYQLICFILLLRMLSILPNHFLYYIYTLATGTFSHFQLEDICYQQWLYYIMWHLKLQHESLGYLYWCCGRDSGLVSGSFGLSCNIHNPSLPFTLHFFIHPSGCASQTLSSWYFFQSQTASTAELLQQTATSPSLQRQLLRMTSTITSCTCLQSSSDFNLAFSIEAKFEISSLFDWWALATTSIKISHLDVSTYACSAPSASVLCDGDTCKHWHFPRQISKRLSSWLLHFICFQLFQQSYKSPSTALPSRTRHGLAALCYGTDG